MKKRTIVFIILIALFILSSLVFAILGIKPAAKVGKYSSDLELINTVDGLTEIKSFVDSNGNVCFAADKDYAIYEKTKDSTGLVVLECYFDENHLPVLLSSGYHAIEYTYSDNKRVAHYLDCEMNPVQISSGIYVVERTYLSDKTNDYCDMYFDYQMNPMMNSSGCYGIKYLYEGNLSIEFYWLDKDGIPMLCSSGYAHAVRSFNENNRVRTEMYFDDSDEPVAISGTGHYGIQIEYNADGRYETVTSLDSNSVPFANQLGYVTVRYTYNNNVLNTERYFDINGNPCMSGKKWYGVRHDGERLYYLDKNGHDVISIDSILSNFPFLVSIFAIIICLVFLFAPRRMNAFVLVLYFLFIMYETVFFRLRHAPTINLDLFWSYSQFFSNPELRIEILNNIWLFIPYSLGLLSTLKRKTIIVCLMLLPIVVEVIQGVGGIGLFELDDLVSNGIGEIIGIVIWLISRDLRKKKLGKDVESVPHL